MQTVTYPYSKLGTLFITLFLLAIAFLMFYSLTGSINDNSLELIFSIILVFCLCASIVYIVVKYLVPAFTNKIALEFNSDSLIFYSRDITIKWKDLQKLELKSGRQFYFLYVTFKEGSVHENTMYIPLTFVAGRASKIYETAKNYVDVG